jgi:hypothetical protein
MDRVWQQAGLSRAILEISSDQWMLRSLTYNILKLSFIEGCCCFVPLAKVDGLKKIRSVVDEIFNFNTLNILRSTFIEGRLFFKQNSTLVWSPKRNFKI